MAKVTSLGFSTLLVAVDNYGNPIVAGGFLYSVGNGNLKINATSNPGGFFVTKLDTSGQEVWVSHVIEPTPLNETQVTHIGIDVQNQIYVTGRVSANLNFGGQMVTNSNNSNFLAKLNSAGQWTWAPICG